MIFYRVQLSISSTRALFHKYCVAMKYRWICKFLILNESPPLRIILSREDNFLSSILNRSIVHATRSSMYCSRCLSHFWLTSPYLGLVWHVDILCFTCVGARYPLSGLLVLSFVKYFLVLQIEILCVYCVFPVCKW